MEDYPLFVSTKLKYQLCKAITMEIKQWCNSIIFIEPNRTATPVISRGNESKSITSEPRWIPSLVRQL